MKDVRKALCALAVLEACAGTLPSAKAAATHPAIDHPAAPATSADALATARWAVRARDHRGRSFAVVDKRSASLYVFASDGRLAGATPVLLGATVGDRGMPSLGALPPSRIPRDERKTPAGRFASVPGTNLDGEDVVWFDYAEGLAIHRLRANGALPARLARLDARDASAHRVSAGCVVVPVAFYERVVRPLLGHGKGTLYVLPEQGSLKDFLAALGDD